jgi:hypothetical protein
VARTGGSCFADFAEPVPRLLDQAAETYFAPIEEVVPPVWTAHEQRRRGRLAFAQEQTHRRDRTRSLPPAVRNLTLRLAAERIFRSNYGRLRDPH